MKINLERDDQDRDKPRPWEPLDGVSRDEALVLRKTLTYHVDQGWIRARHSLDGAPVLCVTEPGGHPRVCGTCRTRDTITEKDWYPRPFRDQANATGNFSMHMDQSPKLIFTLRSIHSESGEGAKQRRLFAHDWVRSRSLSHHPVSRELQLPSKDMLIHRQVIMSIKLAQRAYLDDIFLYMCPDGDINDHRQKVKRRYSFHRRSRIGFIVNPTQCECAKSSK